MEAFALRRVPQGGTLTGAGLRESSDEALVARLRDGDESAFEAIVDRYRAPLLRFCRRMLRSTEDAEDVLQEVLANAYRAILADEREINLRPWLYRIARNRCLNHLQRIRAIPEEQERLERIPTPDAAATHERVQNREQFLQMLADVQGLPEAQRQALLLCELDGLSYAEIGEEMTTTVPAIRSLLTRARATLAESSQAREMTCGEVVTQLTAAAAEGRRAPGPARRHLRGCEACSVQFGSSPRGIAALSPIGLLIAAKELVFSKLGFGAAGGSGAAGATGGPGAAGAAAGAGGGLAAGLGAVNWAAGSKVAAATIAVVAVAGGASQVSGGGNLNQLQRVAPALKAVPQPTTASAPDRAESTASASVEAPSSPFDRATGTEPGTKQEAVAAQPLVEPDADLPASPFGEDPAEPEASVASPPAVDEIFRP